MFSVILSTLFFLALLTLSFYGYSRYQTARVMRQCAKCDTQFEKNALRHWYTLDDKEVALCSRCHRQGGLVY